MPSRHGADKRIVRPCLGPLGPPHSFRSRGPHNRLCDRCRKATERLAPILASPMSDVRDDGRIDRRGAQAHQGAS